ncbi:hypothetical protein [Clostridium sp. JS66]|uniref:hypothetical protein n=1 Tax=Clostridium sp. JS66 TaxID=3064705 RepID=UPI00298DC005|nr:hypothetical protein [Clostridium sp. JS66]WPC41633.1 hypothetical protein Q6H37_27835 [Clostridium sp. JS66]
MACRHDDIARCKSDIQKITEIGELLAVEEGINLLVTLELSSLASNCEATFSCINMEELKSEEKKLNKDISDLLPKLIKECASKLVELGKELVAMEIEDFEYHMEEH